MSIKRISVLKLCHVLKPFVKSTPGPKAMLLVLYVAASAPKFFSTAVRLFAIKQLTWFLGESQWLLVSRTSYQRYAFV